MKFTGKKIVYLVFLLFPCVNFAKNLNTQNTSIESVKAPSKANIFLKDYTPDSQTELLEYFSLNARSGKKNTLSSALNFNYDRGIKNHYGGYLQAKYPKHQTIKPYLIAGFTIVEMNFKKPSFPTNQTFNDFSYGVGAYFEIAVDLAASFEYMSYVSNKIKNNTLYDLDGFTISIIKKF